MKHSGFALLLLFLFISASISGCREEEDEVIQEAPTKLTAKFDGVEFEPLWSAASYDPDELVLGGSNFAGDLTMHLGDSTTVGTYNFQSNPDECIVWYDNADEVEYAANPGCIIISKLDTANRKIEGTFTGTLTATGYPSISLTEGFFRLDLNM